MRAGKLVEDVHYNYELLNKLFNMNYKNYYKAEYSLGNGSFVWMVYLDGIERNGWINEKKDDIITEKYVGGKPYPNNIDTGLHNKIRLVFEKAKNYNKQYYIFRGVYELKEGTHEYRLLQKISDETTLF